MVADGPAEQPTVSVLVAAWNEAPRIAACLASLVAIPEPSLEILVSAGGDDGTEEIAARYASERVRVIRQQPGQGKQAALRELFALASGKIVYLTDGDTVVSAQTLQAVLGPIVRGEAEAVTGNYRPYATAVLSPLVFYQWSIDRAVGRRSRSEVEGITGANAALTRAALVATGGFAGDVHTGTDYVLARQLRAAGYAIRYVDAGVETEYADGVRLYARRRSRWLRNTFLHGRRLGDRAEVRNSLTTMGIAVVVLAAPATFPLTKRWGGLAWGTLVALLLKRRIRYAADLIRETDAPAPRAFFLWLPFLTLLDQLSSVLALADLLSQTRRTRW